MIVVITQEGQPSSKIPTFILPEMVGIRNTALVFEAVNGKCTGLTQHASAESNFLFGGSV